MQVLALPLVALLSASAPAPQDAPWTGVLDEASFAALHELRADRAPELRGERIELGDTRPYLSVPEFGEPLGGVVVVHEWWGLNEHVMHWADRLAADGYVALAVDLYGGKVATTREEAMAAMRAVDSAAALATLREAYAWLSDERDLERIGSIGWCFGGGWSLQLALAEPDQDAAVMYYGRTVTDAEELGKLQAPVLAVFGDRDEGLPPELVREFRDAMEAAGKSLELRTYDAEHAFANPSSANYDAEHAAAAWKETRAFLCEHLWPAQDSGLFSDGTRDLEVTYDGGWDETGERPMRLATYEVSGGTECYVAALRGDAGGVEANLNRWRTQLGEDPLDSDEIAELPRIPMFGRMAVAMRAHGRFQPMSGDAVENAALLGAICELDDEVVFVKLVGPRATVEDAEERFAAFCRGLR